MNIFEHAARNRVRFTSPVGDLTVEDLWDLPLVAKEGRASLNACAIAASQELKAMGEENFVAPVQTPAKADAELRLEIIKYVIAEKQAERTKAQKAAENAQAKREIIAALAQKQGEALRNMTEDELKAKLASLEEA